MFSMDGLMTAPLLQVRHLRVEFPTRRGTLLALDDVSFDIAPGEVLGVVGESGAGKSLTGAAIIGLLEPPGRIAGGEILFEGVDLLKLDPGALRDLRGARMAMKMREDVVTDGGYPDKVLSNAPDRAGQFYAVPKVVE